MDIETKLDLARAEPTEEIITIDEMRALFETNSQPVHYYGLEISGVPHIGHLFVGGKKINDFAEAGMKTTVLLADWHTMANNKLGGDWEKIKSLAKFYEKLFNAFCPGTRVVLGSDLYKDNDEYWKYVLRMSSKTTMARATRTLIIEGRSEKDALHVSQYIYPIMQAADIAALGVDVPHAGMDQRRVHMLAKEIFSGMGLKGIVPVHHHLIPSMLKPPNITEGMEKEEIVAEMKMSKSKQGSAISLLDTDETIRSTLRNAWCPERAIEGNPVLDLIKYVILPNNGVLAIERKREHGGDVSYQGFAELSRDYSEGMIHPLDLKQAAASELIKTFGRIRPVVSKERDDVLKLLSG